MIFKPQLIDRVWKKVNVGRTGYKERLKKDGKRHKTYRSESFPVN